MKFRYLVGVTVVVLAIFGGIKAYAIAHEQSIMSKLAKGTPEAKSNLTDRVIKTQGYTYKLKYYSDAVDVSNFKTSGHSAELARPGKTDTSFIISLAPADVYKDCADGTLKIPYRIEYATGMYSVCTTSKSPALVMRFKDTKGTWHRVIFFAASLHSLSVNEETFRTILSSISVE